MHARANCRESALAETREGLSNLRNHLKGRVQSTPPTESQDSTLESSSRLLIPTMHSQVLEVLQPARPSEHPQSRETFQVPHL